MAEKPLFIKLEGYNELTDMLNMVKVKIAEAKESIARIDQLRQEEEAELDLWSNELEEVEKKMAAIDSDLMAARE